MAYDYDKVKQQYEALSPEKQQQFANMMKNDTSGNYTDFMNRYNAEKNQTNNVSTAGTANYSNNNAKVWTWAVAWINQTTTISPISKQSTTTTTTTTKPTTNYQSNMSTKETWPANLSSTPKTQYATNIADYWNGLSYEEQQAKLKSNSALKSYIQSQWLVEKKPQSTKATWPVSPTTTTQPTQKDKWDYQDNSQARMDQIAHNLDWYRVTNPELFDDYTTFYNFFIDWKGRSQDQINYLNDYFNRVKQNNKYNTLSSEEVWNGIVNGKIPESYLSDIQATNPERVDEIKEEIKKAEDSIKNQSYLQSLVEQASTDTWDSSFWEWNKKEMWYKDENNDWIDDRNYHPATEEELKNVERINEINARRMEIKNMQKTLLEDLTKQYPWVPKATLMWIVQDRTNDISREYDDLSVELTQLQWTVDYQQSERQQMDKAGQQTIADIQKNYGIYYDYSPEWIVEQTQAKYAATNVTLDQADNGTDTQKQMALQWVLDDYYNKYWTIIQRSEQQVINDVMAYAKNRWISLSQALQENFITPLKSKPEYAQLNQVTSNPNVVRIWTDANGNPIYWTYNSTTWKFDPIDLSWFWISTRGSSNGGKTTTPWWVTYNSVSEDSKINWLSDFLSWLNVWDYGGECWAFVNDYLEKIWAWRVYDNDLSTKLNSVNSDAPEVWSIAVFDYSNAPSNSSISDKARKHGHVGIVVWVDDKKGTVTIVESNKDWDKTISKPREIPMNNLYLKWYFNPSKWYTEWQSDSFDGKFADDSDWNANWYFNSLIPYFKTIVQEWKIDLTDAKYKDVLKDYWITSKEFNEMAANYADTELKSAWWQQAANALEYAIKTYELLYWDKSKIWNNWLTRNVWQVFPWSEQEKAKAEYNSLKKRLSLKELFAAKELWATFGAMSDSEWNLLEQASTDVDWRHSNFKENLEWLIQSLYDAAIDWKATLPSNLKWSSLEQTLTWGKTSWGNWWSNDIYSDLY